MAFAKQKLNEVNDTKPDYIKAIMNLVEQNNKCYRKPQNLAELIHNESVKNRVLARLQKQDAQRRNSKFPDKAKNPAGTISICPCFRPLRSALFLKRMISAS